MGEKRGGGKFGSQRGEGKGDSFTRNIAKGTSRRWGGGGGKRGELIRERGSQRVDQVPGRKTEIHWKHGWGPKRLEAGAGPSGERKKYFGGGLLQSVPEWERGRVLRGETFPDGGNTHNGNTISKEG